jgi:uncharacterized protein (TIRG00374 family)
VCVLLLLWIFHTIFLNEGRAWAQREGLHWEQMARGQQWQLAWSKGPGDLWQMLTRVQPWALVVSMLLVGATVWLGVVRWQLVLKTQGINLTMGRAAKITLVAQFFNSFLLGSTGGDFIKAYYAARETHHQKTEAVTTVFVDRLVGLWAMLFFACAMIAPNWRMLTHSELALPALVIFGMLVALSVVLSLAFWGGVSKRFPRARSYLRRLPKGELLERSLDSCRQFGKKRAFLAKSVLLSLFLNIVWVLQISVLGTGLGLNMSLIPLMVIVPIIFCISAIPITPNGLGLRENLYVHMLEVIAVQQTPALSLSLLASAEGLFWSMIGGLVYMGLRDKEHLAEVTRENGRMNGAV